MAYLAESGHWYDRSGNPAYEVPNKSRGGMRPTRITDAKKLNLVPSVTTVIGILDKPALTNWKIERILDSAIEFFDSDRPAIEPEKIKPTIKDMAFGADVTGVDRGTEIHAAIELWFKGVKDHRLVMSNMAWVTMVEEYLYDTFGHQEWNAEKSFSHPMGYGGKVDLCAPGIVVDFKTKDFSKGRPKAYQEHGMQLGAYALGLGYQDPVAINLFIDRNEPSYVVHGWTESEVRNNINDFLAVLDVWRRLKRFDTRY